MSKTLFASKPPGVRGRLPAPDEEFDFSDKKLCPYYPDQCQDRAVMCAECVPPRDAQVARRRYIPCCRLDLVGKPKPGTLSKGEGLSSGISASSRTIRGHGRFPSPDKTVPDSSEREVGFLIDIHHLRVDRGDERTHPHAQEKDGRCRTCRWWKAEYLILSTGTKVGYCKEGPHRMKKTERQSCGRYLHNYKGDTP